MQTKRRTTITAMLPLALGLVLMAGQKPNFSGTWVPDPEKSEMGRGGGRGRGGFGGEGGRRGGGPGSRGMGRGGRGGMMGNLTIDHQDPQFSIKRAVNSQGQGDVRETKSTTDGKENINEGFGGMGVPSRTRWEGNQLVTESDLETPMGVMEIKEVRSLSDDGKVMTVKRTTLGGRGERTQKMV